MSPRPRPFVPTMNAAEEGTLKGQLIKLGMYTIAASFEVEAERAAKDETPYAAYLARLIELEMTDKADRSVNARIARARFPVIRTLEEFDFTFQPGLSAVRVRELANLAFLDHATNVLFIGGPGVGKTHLAISLGLKACGARRSVLFSSAADLLDELVAAEVSHNLGKVLAHLRRVDLLIVDELGYLPMDGRRANLFFQLVAARYTRFVDDHQQRGIRRLGQALRRRRDRFGHPRSPPPPQRNLRHQRTQLPPQGQARQRLT